ncbi:DUF3231 family protein [Alkalihalobacillus sp. AL-G]|uniref:DUF3231 family protein n=1 Tax=Alkalihalobacillus sp. AL-G TaxID=2926399 RepID=UPI00272A0347|nr:DUF3231 family protein [Alkalihalobacillus sp. AL-G]WLD94682.1 DUF3231 family protein [Alkalihalobacillus sp. AL-G]
MDRDHDAQLTSAEMAGLWGQYINDTAARSVLAHFLMTVEDSQVRLVLELAFSSCKNHIEFLQGFFEQATFPIPVGFSKKDVNLQAPRLFSDLFYLSYLKNMSILGMTASTLAIGLAARSDVVSFHKKVLADAVKLHKAAKEVMMEKGVYVRPPYISTPDEVDFATKQSFLGKLWGDQRPLTTVEMTHLFLNIETNVVGKQMMVAFTQVAKRKKVKEFLVRGKEIAEKHVNIFSQIQLDDDIPATMSWDTAVTDSTVPTFSDKLIMFHVTAMIAAGIGNYGTAISVSPRKDIGIKYSRLLMEISLYAEDGANIMIDHGWLEKPPHAPDRNQLVK